MLEQLRQSRGWQFLLIVALIFVVPLMVDINERMNVIRRMRHEEARLAGELAAVQAEHEALQAQLEFVAGDAYLEQWARVDARMTKPGEVAIVPLSAERPEPRAPTPENVYSPVSASSSIPQQWHRLFYDDASAP